MSKFDPYEHLKIIKNKDGTLTRLMEFPQIPATGDGDGDLRPGQTVVSKDVTLNATTNTWLRLFRPAKIPSNARLPVVLYFHAGGWINFRVSDALNHDTMTKLSGEIPAIAVAVNYRLAPETKLPGQYDDALDALHWLQSQSQSTNPNGDPWITQFGDFSRVFLYGTSSGANIVLHTALRIIDTNLTPITIAGTILSQPLIGGRKRTKSEIRLAADTLFPLPVIDLLWELALPEGTDRDHRYCNPLGDEHMKEKMKKMVRCLVIGFGGDPLIDRQQELVQMMVMQGVVVEARFDDVGFHGIEMVDPRRASAILGFVKEFIG